MKKIIALAMAIMFILTSAIMVSAKNYEVTEWAEEANDALGITWQENPTRNIEKGEFMFVFLRAIQANLERSDEELLTSNTKLSFSDLDELDDDEIEEARILKDLGVLTGYQNKMDMYDDLTRAQAAKILYYFNSEVFELKNKRTAIHFSDTVDHWAESFITSAYRTGFINGKGKDSTGYNYYDPEGDITIEETIQILYNICINSDAIDIEDAACALVQTFNCETSLDLDISSSALYLTEGEKFTITLSDDNGFWSSSNSNVAHVSSKGVITANEAGTAIITHTSGFSLVIKVDATSKYVSVGDTVSVSDYRTSSWRSSNTRIATVNSEATVTGVKPGTVTISRGSYESHNVIVVDSTVINIKVDETENIGSSKYGKWSSDNTDVATVSSNGTIKALKPGTATISNKYVKYFVVVQATSRIDLAIGDSIVFESGSWESSNNNVVSASGKTIKALRRGTAHVISGDISIEIVVENPNSSSTSSKRYTMEVGEQRTIGSGKYDSSWESSNERIATVSSYGKVNAKKVGSVYISNDTTDYYITVVDKYNDYDDYNLSATVGDTLMLGDGSYDSSWTSSNTSIATVTKYGKASFKKDGTVIISNDYEDYTIKVTSRNSSTDLDDDETHVSLEGFAFNTYANVWVGDTSKVIVESANGKLTDVTLSNTKCAITKNISSLGNDKYTFTVTSKTAGSCIATLTFSDGEKIEFTFNIYKD